MLNLGLDMENLLQPTSALKKINTVKPVTNAQKNAHEKFFDLGKYAFISKLVHTK